MTGETEDEIRTRTLVRRAKDRVANALEDIEDAKGDLSLAAKHYRAVGMDGEAGQADSAWIALHMAEGALRNL